ncbi:hypothetical protein Syn6312_2824 [Synechococcus sp. PCC 6312]|nr:hypothetical protein Syn6312_2824 [Synechococcus sp. PCC 6312]
MPQKLLTTATGSLEYETWLVTYQSDFRTIRVVLGMKLGIFRYFYDVEPTRHYQGSVFILCICQDISIFQTLDFFHE